MDGQILQCLKNIEANSGRLRNIEQLLERAAQSNEKIEDFLERMLKMYEEASQKLQQ